MRQLGPLLRVAALTVAALLLLATPAALATQDDNLTPPGTEEVREGELTGQNLTEDEVPGEEDPDRREPVQASDSRIPNGEEPFQQPFEAQDGAAPFWEAGVAAAVGLVLLAAFLVVRARER